MKSFFLVLATSLVFALAATAAMATEPRPGDQLDWDYPSDWQEVPGGYDMQISAGSDLEDRRVFHLKDNHTIERWIIDCQSGAMRQLFVFYPDEIEEGGQGGFRILRYGNGRDIAFDPNKGEQRFIRNLVCAN